MFRGGLLRIVIGLIICSCGSTQSTGLSNHSQPFVPSGKGTRQLTKRELLLAEAELAWAKRDKYEQVENAIEYWRQALAIDSHDIETWNRISRAYLFLVELLCVYPEARSTADEIEADRQHARDTASESSRPTRIPAGQEAKRKPFRTGLNECRPLTTEAEENLRRSEQMDLLQRSEQAAEQALAICAPDILKQIEGAVISIESLNALSMDAVTSLYWHSATLNALSRFEGYVDQVIQKDPVNISMATCLKKKPRYDHGGPHRYFGTFFARPFSLTDKDLERSKMHLKRAIAIAPGFFANRYAYARDYAIMAQDRKTFETQLKTILEANIESDPSTAPENRIYRRKAEILLRLASEHFE